MLLRNLLGSHGMSLLASMGGLLTGGIGHAALDGPAAEAGRRLSER